MGICLGLPGLTPPLGLGTEHECATGLADCLGSFLAHTLDARSCPDPQVLPSGQAVARQGRAGPQSRPPEPAPTARHHPPAAGSGPGLAWLANASVRAGLSS
jgi:hypothetical protein